MYVVREPYQRRSDRLPSYDVRLAGVTVTGTAAARNLAVPALPQAVSNQNGPDVFISFPEDYYGVISVQATVQTHETQQAKYAVVNYVYSDGCKLQVWNASEPSESVLPPDIVHVMVYENGVAKCYYKGNGGGNIA